MRPISDLIDRDQPAWPEVKRWIDAARDRAEILPTTRDRGERTLYAVQVSTRSPMGAIAFESAGILIDHGWLRILGGGGPGMNGSLASWNGLDGKAAGHAPPYMIVAHDVIGGFFAVNGGGLPGRPGTVCYFAPDSLIWEDLGIGYTQLLQLALSDKLDQFYEGRRWPGWEKEVRALEPDKGIAFFPPLWSTEGQRGPNRRSPVPMRDLWTALHSARTQLDTQSMKPAGEIKIELRSLSGKK